ncbi:MAG: hypothetical protein KAW12_16790 [Candidatus Aminicenantes bacterium]|nr:hypothetical protein [Candidatus Aminicenantes bacterium]
MHNKKIVEEIGREIEKIEKLFDEYESLLTKIIAQEPDFIEIGSLAMLMHSFYNGLEKIFSRIAKKIDEQLPDGMEWYKELLELMAKQTGKREYVVLSKKTCEELKEYLGFRHFIRNAYAFDLNWDLMRDLVLRSNDVKSVVLGEIRSFIKKIVK